VSAAVVRIAAFDVDGTLIKGQSQAYFTATLVKRGLASPSLMLRVFGWYALMRLGVPVDQAKAQRRVIASLAGLPQARMDQVLDDFVAASLVPRIRPGAHAEISRLRAVGCRIVLVSAAPAPIIARLSRILGADGYVATVIAPPVDGKFSGRIEGVSVLGREKVARLTRYADAVYGAWELHAAYGDQEVDGPLLSTARYPVAVHPCPGLLKMAAANDWPVQAW
jgi:HAD superfamily hydrolase (TIGR01490 family)